MTTALTTQEASDLRACEAVIMKGLKTFREVGIALAKVRDSRLYRQNYKTFEAYCADKLKIAKSHAYRLIEASKTPLVSPTGDAIDTEHKARKHLQEKKYAAAPKPEPVADDYGFDEFDTDDPRNGEEDADGGAAPEQPLAWLEPDPVGASEDRIEWVIAGVNDLWLSYKLHFTADAQRFAFVAGLENWQARTQ